MREVYTPNAAAEQLLRLVVPFTDTLEEKELGSKIYAAAEACGMEPKAFFTASYEALIGKEQGPRLASFLKTIGKSRLEAILSACTGRTAP